MCVLSLLVKVKILESVSPEVVKQVLKKGSHFGEKSLLFDIPMIHSVVAVTHVDVFFISRKDFEDVFDDHPDTLASIMHEAVENEVFVEPESLI